MRDSVHDGNAVSRQQFIKTLLCMVEPASHQLPMVSTFLQGHHITLVCLLHEQKQLHALEQGVRQAPA